MAEKMLLYGPAEAQCALASPPSSYEDDDISDLSPPSLSRATHVRVSTGHHSMPGWPNSELTRQPFLQNNNKPSIHSLSSFSQAQRWVIHNLLAADEVANQTCCSRYSVDINRDVAEDPRGEKVIYYLRTHSGLAGALCNRAEATFKSHFTRRLVFTSLAEVNSSVKLMHLFSKLRYTQELLWVRR